MRSASCCGKRFGSNSSRVIAGKTDMTAKCRTTTCALDQPAALHHALPNQSVPIMRPMAVAGMTAAGWLSTLPNLRAGLGASRPNQAATINNKGAAATDNAPESEAESGAAVAKAHKLAAIKGGQPTQRRLQWDVAALVSNKASQAAHSVASNNSAPSPTWGNTVMSKAPKLVNTPKTQALERGKLCMIRDCANTKRIAHHNATGNTPLASAQPSR
jgi:hypothetical protein